MKIKIISCFIPFVMCTTSIVVAKDISGNIALEGTLYPQEGLYDKQQKTGGVSVSIQPEFKQSWDNDHKVVTISPFVRWDQQDEKRTHADIRQMDITVANGDWEVQAGIGKVFWGVTESRHLVDVINQTDNVENIDGEEKLGQPMIRVSRLTDNGSIDAYILPYFRERTFPGNKGRFRAPLPVDTDSATYESSSKKKHLDYALRWANTIGDFDVGLHYFKGTSRDPKFIPRVKNGKPVLTPHYEQMSQVGLDLQHTGEELTLKLEAINRDTSSENYTAVVAGAEYALPPLGESDVELSLLTEYLHDSRGKKSNALFQNDIFFGARLALNDEDSSELLAGTVIDLDNATKSLRFEASKRLTDGFKVNLEGQLFTDVDNTDPVNLFKKDDYVKLELQKFFAVKLPETTQSRQSVQQLTNNTKTEPKKELIEGFPEFKEIKK